MYLQELGINRDSSLCFCQFALRGETRVLQGKPPAEPGSARAMLVFAAPILHACLPCAYCSGGDVSKPRKIPALGLRWRGANLEPEPTTCMYAQRFFDGTRRKSMHFMVCLPLFCNERSCVPQQQLRQLVTYAVDAAEGSPSRFPTAYTKFYAEKLRLVQPLQSPLHVCT
jgi:hypothetical protein